VKYLTAIKCHAEELHKTNCHATLRYDTIRYDSNIFIVRSEADIVSLIYSTVL